MDEEGELIAVSPRHSVRLDPAYVALVRRAPRRDYVVRTIMRREANGLPLVSAEIVIAGEDARKAFVAAAKYPLHFRKTYFPGRLHGDPKVEFDRQHRAHELIGLPPPIGHAPDTFRACLIPGLPYNRLSPFGVEPEEANLPLARDLTLSSAAGLWRLCEQAYEHLRSLHRGGLCHGDAELHNFIVSPSPLEILPIDFEGASERQSEEDTAWEQLCRKDLAPLLREAVFLLCALGQQPGELAEMAYQRMDGLFKHPARFQREIGFRTNPSA